MSTSPPSGSPQPQGFISTVISSVRDGIDSARQGIDSARTWYAVPENRYIVKGGAVGGATLVGLYETLSRANGAMEIPMYLLAAWVAGWGMQNGQEIAAKIRNHRHRVDLTKPHQRDGYKAAAATVWSVGAWDAAQDYVGSSGVLQAAGSVLELLALGTGGYVLHQALQHHNEEIDNAQQIIDANRGRAAMSVKQRMLHAGISEKIANQELARAIKRHQRQQNNGIAAKVENAWNWAMDGEIVRPTTRRYLADTARTIADFGKNTVQTAKDISTGAQHYIAHAPWSLAGRTALYAGALAGIEFLASYYQVEKSAAYHLLAAASIAAVGAINARQIRTVGAEPSHQRMQRIEKQRRAIIPKQKRFYQRGGVQAAVVAGTLLALGSVLYSAAASRFEGTSQHGIRPDNSAISGTPPPLLQEQLPWPVVPVDREAKGDQVIISRYGFRPGGGLFVSSNHLGADIGPTAGEYDAIAVGDGIVTRVNKCRGLVTIDHGKFMTKGSGLSTLYMHGEEIYVKTGDHVKKGQHILRVGGRDVVMGVLDDGTCSLAKYMAQSSNTRRAQHLHFEIRTNEPYYRYYTGGSAVEQGRINPECFLGEPGKNYKLGNGLDTTQPRNLDLTCNRVWDSVKYKDRVKYTSKGTRKK